MKNNRLFAIGVCFGIALVQAHLLPAQSDLDLSLLGTGNFTLETVSLEKGSGIAIETDLQHVAAIIVEDSTGKELVRIGTPGIQQHLQLRKEGRPESDVMTDADSIRGRFEYKTTHDLTAVTALRVTLVLTNGIEIPFTMESRGSIANRRMTRTFGVKACSTYSQTCSSDTSPTERCSKTCCTDTVCYDCFPCSITCGPCDGDDPETGCSSAPPPAQQTLAISFDGKAGIVALPKSPFVLGRMEPGKNVSYLMEEWAVVVASRQRSESTPGIEVLKASSPAFGSVITKDLVQEVQNARLRQKRYPAAADGVGQPLLIVVAPVHPHNSRFVPTPTLSLSDTEPPTGTSHARVLVRADFSEEEDTVAGLQILHADGAVPPKLLEILGDRMALDRKPGERHRTVVFTLVNIGDAIEVTSLATVFPKCCCGGRWCV